jgi:metal-responsive CopG/Arc/MetJ family transcriptional regulator
MIMANIPNEKKKVKISISIDNESNNKLDELTIKGEFYKKSRLINFIIKKYLEDNDN